MGIEENTQIEVIKDPYSIQNSYYNLVRAARREILLFLPTTSAFLREEKIGIIQSLIDAVARGVSVKVLTPADEKIGPRIEAMLQNDNIAIRQIRRRPSPHASTEARTKILVIDRKTYLIVELGDDSKETFVDAVRSAIRSNSSSTVMSYVTMFESLWQESDLYDQLEVHDRMQKEFINIASHELRTPIQPILGMIEMLDSRFASENEECKISKEELQLLVRNANRLARLSEDILEVSRIESNSLTLHIEKFDVNEKARNIVFDARKLIERGRRLDIEIKTGEPVFVEADKIKIFEVIMNLLTNAIKFTQEGTITVQIKRFDKYVQIEVKDTGKGIDPSILPKLFTKFTSTADQGTGLGLYISKNIVEAHAGRIWAENNRNGKGATFAFTLPVAKASA
jgi:signal transduction histidine kinase